MGLKTVVSTKSKKIATVARPPKANKGKEETTVEAYDKYKFLEVGP